MSNRPLLADDQRQVEIESIASPYGLSQIGLVSMAIQGLGAITLVYLTNEPAAGGLGFSVTTGAAFMTMQGLVGVVSGPFIGDFIDKTSRKRTFLSSSLLLSSITYLMLTGIGSPCERPRQSNGTGLNHLLHYSTSESCDCPSIWTPDNTCVKVISQTRVALALALQGAVGAVYPPGTNAISLGLVGVDRLPSRAARNEVWRHLGMILVSVIPIVFIQTSSTSTVSARGVFDSEFFESDQLVINVDDLAKRTKPPSYELFFYILAGMGVAGIIFTLMIRPGEVDNSRARGMPRDNEYGSRAIPDPVREVIRRWDIICLFAAIVFFHFGNAAMLPFVAKKIGEINNVTNVVPEVTIFNSTIAIDAKNAVSLCNIVGQVVMIPTAILCGWLAKQRWCGSKRALVVGYGLLIVRGVVFAISESVWVLLGTQFLDGVCNGAFGILAVLIMSDLTQGTGRFNMMQGALATGIGLGGALSQLLAGSIVDSGHGNNYTDAFIAMASIAGVATFLLCLIPHTKFSNESRNLPTAPSLNS